MSKRSLIFLDESAISTTLHHAYGRAPKGQRVRLYAPTYGARRTLVGAIALDGRKALGVVEKGLRIESFLEFIRSELAPMLKPGDVVIMDNLRVHTNREAVTAIEACGAEVVFQPRYSPEWYMVTASRSGASCSRRGARLTPTGRSRSGSSACCS